MRIERLTKEEVGRRLREIYEEAGLPYTEEEFQAHLWELFAADGFQ
jgi:hypothetical protein